MRVGIAGGGLGGLAAALFLSAGRRRGRARLRAAVRAAGDRRRDPDRAERRAAAAAARALGRAAGRSGSRSRCRGSSGAGRTGACCSRMSYDGSQRYGAPYLAIHRARPAAGARRRAPGRRGLARPARRPASTARRSCSSDGSAVRVRRDDRRRRHPLRRARGDRRRRRRRSSRGCAAYRALVPAERGAGVRAPAGLLDLARAAPSTSCTTRSRAARRSTSSPRTRRATGARSPGRRPARSPTSSPSTTAGTTGVVALIAAARETKRYAFYAREPVTRWVSGHVALLGDAAHPMLPFFAQGAGQAIEDGAVLAGLPARALRTSRRRCGATRRCASSARRACSG